MLVEQSQFLGVRTLADWPQSPLSSLTAKYIPPDMPQSGSHPQITLQRVYFHSFMLQAVRSLSLHNSVSPSLSQVLIFQDSLPSFTIVLRWLSYLPSVLFFYLTIISNLFLALLSISYSLLLTVPTSWPGCKFLDDRGILWFTLSSPPACTPSLYLRSYHIIIAPQVFIKLNWHNNQFMN